MRIPYDTIGSKEKQVAIIAMNYKYPKKAARIILERHKNVKSVLQKTSERKGKYRLHPCKLIAGDRNTEVIHKEYGYSIKVDPQKVFFSPRESTERQRITNMVSPRENILIMFSGAAPYAIAISKKQHSCKITCVDINPNAIRYAEENVKLNKLNNVKNVCIDVRKWKNKDKFDRIIMPLAEGAIDYLDVAYAHSKKGTIIHLYGLSSEPNLKDFKEIIKHITKDIGMKFKIIGKDKVLPYAPRIMKVRFDLKVL